MQSDTTHEQAFTSGMQSRRLKLATGLGQAGEPMVTIPRLLVIDKLHAVIYLPPRSKMTFTSVLSSFCFLKLLYGSISMYFYMQYASAASKISINSCIQ